MECYKKINVSRIIMYNALLPHKTSFTMVSYVKSIAHMCAHILQTALKEGPKLMKSISGVDARHYLNYACAGKHSINVTNKNQYFHLNFCKHMSVIT